MSWGTNTQSWSFAVNCFQDSKHIFLFNIENGAWKKNWKKEHAIPKIIMLHNLSCSETRLRLLWRWFLLDSSLNLAFRLCKLHNNFICGMAYRNFTVAFPIGILLRGQHISLLALDEREWRHVNKLTSQKQFWFLLSGEEKCYFSHLLRRHSASPRMQLRQWTCFTAFHLVRRIPENTLFAKILCVFSKREGVWFSWFNQIL